MRVGILTLQSGYNFGGSLQCEALSKLVDGLGHQVEVLNYIPNTRKEPKIWQGWGLTKKNRLRNVRTRIHELQHFAASRDRYDRYKKTHLRLTQPLTDADQVWEKMDAYDAIIVGSDQVWNLEYHPDPVFYLARPGGWSGRKIGYAACCGKNSGRADDWVGEALQQFDVISVRDEFTRDWVSEQAGCGSLDPPVVLDPTMLHDSQDTADSNAVTSDPYIFVYLIGNCDMEFHRNAITQLRAEFDGANVIVAMATGYKIQLFSWADQTLWQLNPHDWGHWLKKAIFVYTDSYHGVLFSLKYQRPFVATYAEEIRSPRLLDLADRFSLTSHIVKSEGSLPSKDSREKLDWPQLSNILNKARSYSVDFLSNALS